MPFLFALALAAAAPAPASDAPPPAEAQKLLQDCSAHKFETSITVTVQGQPRQSKVKMCGTPGQSDAQWIDTLKDAVAKVSANPKMPPSAKQQIVSAVQAEIVRLGGTAAGVPTEATTHTPALINAPALPAPRPVTGSSAPIYSALPPFPPPVAPGATPALGGASSLAAAAPFVPPLPRPRLTFSCYSAGDIGSGGPCFAFDRDTRITVRAGEALKDTLLRFVRDGDVRADFPLPPLAKGRSASFVLPREVCAHAVGGSLTIRIVRGPPAHPEAAQVVGTEGPYNLRC